MRHEARLLMPMLLLVGGACLHLNVAMGWVSYAALYDEEPKAWAVPLRAPWEWVREDERRGRCQMRRAALLRTGNAGGDLRVDFTEMSECQPSAHAPLLASMFWRPHESGELEAQLTRLRREHGRLWPMLIAADDGIALEQVITFMDALREEEVQWLELVVPEEQCR